MATNPVGVHCGGQCLTSVYVAATTLQLLRLRLPRAIGMRMTFAVCVVQSARISGHATASFKTHMLAAAATAQGPVEADLIRSLFSICPWHLYTAGTQDASTCKSTST